LQWGGAGNTIVNSDGEMTVIVKWDQDTVRLIMKPQQTIDAVILRAQAEPTRTGKTPTTPFPVEYTIKTAASTAFTQEIKNSETLFLQRKSAHFVTKPAKSSSYCMGTHSTTFTHVRIFMDCAYRTYPNC